MNIKDKLINTTEEVYGENYHSHILEIYKIYVEMADRISRRRQTANTFFLTVNTGIIALIGYITIDKQIGNTISFYWLVALAGICLCYSWYRLICSYKDLNSGKFKVIHEIEKLLPISPYDAEWEAIGKGKDSKMYLPFTRVEIIVPWFFLCLHAVVFVRSFPWVGIIKYIY